jgi:hypothetical protein
VLLSREKGAQESPQTFLSPKLRIIFPLTMRKAARRAFQMVFQAFSMVMLHSLVMASSS